MKSKITIDVDYDNQPVIHVEYFHSDDVRDKLVGKFLAAFNSGNIYTVGRRSDKNSPETDDSAILRPVFPNDYNQFKEMVVKTVDGYEQVIDSLKKY